MTASPPSPSSHSNAAAEPETPHERWFLRHVLPRLRTAVAAFRKPPAFLGRGGEVDLAGLQVRAQGAAGAGCRRMGPEVRGHGGQ